MNTNTPIIVEVTVNASFHKVWKAITDKNEMKLWYFDIPDFIVAVGHVFNFYEPGGEKKYHDQGKILDSIPQSKTQTYLELS